MKKKQKTTINWFSQESMNLFTMLSGYFLIVLVLYSLFQFVKISNLLIIQLLGIIVPIIVYLIKKTKSKLNNKIITIILYLFILIVLPFLYNKTYDITEDGNSYHKTAIAFIKNGWNPLYETARDFQKDNKNVIEIAKDERVDLWMEHYPKATWIIAAVIYEMTGNIESGKCITLIFSIMLLIISYNCLNKILDKRWSIIITILMLINPIVLAQLFSYYLDGIMGMLFTIELFLLTMVNPKEKLNIATWISLISICTVFTNLKFTGLLCSGVIAAVYYFYWLIKNRKSKDFINIFKRVTLGFIVVFVTAIFVVGANSYLKNTVDHHNPLYPLMGKNKVDIITTMQPKKFSQKNKMEKFIISTFSKTQNVLYDGEPQLKMPIKVYRSEISELYAPDVRMAGFGPLSAVVLLITIVLLPIALIKLYKYEKENIKYVLLPIVSIIIASLLVGEFWWARYVPQLYLMPLITIGIWVYLIKYFKKKLLAKLCVIVLITVIIVNMSFFSYIIYREINIFKDITSDIKELKNTKDLKLKTTTKNLYGYYYTLNDNGVKYTIVDDIPEGKSRYKYCWRLVVESNETVS